MSKRNVLGRGKGERTGCYVHGSYAQVQTAKEKETRNAEVSILIKRRGKGHKYIRQGPECVAMSALIPWSTSQDVSHSSTGCLLSTQTPSPTSHISKEWTLPKR